MDTTLIAPLEPETSPEALPASSTPPLTRAQKTLRTLGWLGLGLSLFIFFTLVKLPEARLKNYIQGTISNTLAQQGMTFSAASGSLSVLFGVSYTMKGVVITPPAPDAPIKIDELAISPAFLPLFTGKLGANMSVVQGDGKLNVSFAMGKKDGSLSYSANQLNLGRLGVFALLAKLKGSALASGEGTLSGDLSNPSSLNGIVKLDLKKIVLESQSIGGFSVPQVNASEGTMEVNLGQGKATVRTLKLGKAGGADDLVANVSGDIALGRSIDASTLNLKARFLLSDKVASSGAFSLLTQIMAPAKQGDGYFAYNLTGPLSSPMPTPAGAQ